MIYHTIFRGKGVKIHFQNLNVIHDVDDDEEAHYDTNVNGFKTQPEICFWILEKMPFASCVRVLRSMLNIC